MEVSGGQNFRIWSKKLCNMQSNPEPQRPQANRGLDGLPFVTMDRCLGVHPSCIWNIVRHGLQYRYGVVIMIIMGHK